MSTSDSADVKRTLAALDVHEQWEDAFRTPQNETFYELAFDYLAGVLGDPAGRTILDVGCGIGAHSIRLAQRGLRVTGIDFSEQVLAIGESRVRAAGLAGRVRLQREDVLSLSFPDHAFDFVLCWGVLMHIPDIDRAIAEAIRVLKPGGAMILSEGNMHSLEALLRRWLTPFVVTNKGTVRRTPAGLEDWTVTSAGTLLTRVADVRWLRNELQNHGLVVSNHVAGQFTELYTRVPGQFLKSALHLLNRIWFIWRGPARLAAGNILIARKAAVETR